MKTVSSLNPLLWSLASACNGEMDNRGAPPLRNPRTTAHSGASLMSTYLDDNRGQWRRNFRQKHELMEQSIMKSSQIDPLSRSLLLSELSAPPRSLNMSGVVDRELALLARHPSHYSQSYVNNVQNLNNEGFRKKEPLTNADTLRSPQDSFVQQDHGSVPPDRWQSNPDYKNDLEYSALLDQRSPAESMSSEPTALQRRSYLASRRQQRLSKRRSRSPPKSPRRLSPHSASSSDVPLSLSSTDGPLYAALLDEARRSNIERRVLMKYLNPQELEEHDRRERYRRVKRLEAMGFVDASLLNPQHDNRTSSEHPANRGSAAQVPSPASQAKMIDSGVQTIIVVADADSYAEAVAPVTAPSQPASDSNGGSVGINSAAETFRARIMAAFAEMAPEDFVALFGRSYVPAVLEPVRVPIGPVTTPPNNIERRIVADAVIQSSLQTLHAFTPMADHVSKDSEWHGDTDDEVSHQSHTRSNDATNSSTLMASYIHNVLSSPSPTILRMSPEIKSRRKSSFSEVVDWQSDSDKDDAMCHVDITGAMSPPKEVDDHWSDCDSGEGRKRLDSMKAFGNSLQTRLGSDIESSNLTLVSHHKDARKDSVAATADDEDDHWSDCDSREGRKRLDSMKAFGNSLQTRLGSDIESSNLTLVSHHKDARKDSVVATADDEDDHWSDCDNGEGRKRLNSTKSLGESLRSLVDRGDNGANPCPSPLVSHENEDDHDWPDEDGGEGLNRLVSSSPLNLPMMRMQPPPICATCVTSVSQPQNESSLLVSDAVTCNIPFSINASVLAAFVQPALTITAKVSPGAAESSFDDLVSSSDSQLVSDDAAAGYTTVNLHTSQPPPALPKSSVLPSLPLEDISKSGFKHETPPPPPPPLFASRLSPEPVIETSVLPKVSKPAITDPVAISPDTVKCNADIVQLPPPPPAPPLSPPPPPPPPPPPSLVGQQQPSPDSKSMSATEPVAICPPAPTGIEPISVAESPPIIVTPPQSNPSRPPRPDVSLVPKSSSGPISPSSPDTSDGRLIQSRRAADVLEKGVVSSPGALPISKRQIAQVSEAFRLAASDRPTVYSVAFRHMQTVGGGDGIINALQFSIALEAIAPDLPGWAVELATILGNPDGPAAGRGGKWDKVDVWRVVSLLDLPSEPISEGRMPCGHVHRDGVSRNPPAPQSRIETAARRRREAALAVPPRRPVQASRIPSRPSSSVLAAVAEEAFENSFTTHPFNSSVQSPPKPVRATEIFKADLPSDQYSQRKMRTPTNLDHGGDPMANEDPVGQSDEVLQLINDLKKERNTSRLRKEKAIRQTYHSVPLSKRK